MEIKKKLVVVDLDKTLLTVDSFKIFIAEQYFKSPIKISILKIFRKLRVIGLARYKEWVSRYIYDNLTEIEKRSFIDSLNKYINQQLFKSINNKYGNNCKIIIISASLEQYVKPFAKEIHWEGYGSYRDKKSGKFVHLHGERKLQFLLKYFPINSFKYIYAVSDSISDLILLKQFEQYDLI